MRVRHHHRCEESQSLSISSGSTESEDDVEENHEDEEEGAKAVILFDVSLHISQNIFSCGFLAIRWNALKTQMLQFPSI